MWNRGIGVSLLTALCVLAVTACGGPQEPLATDGASSAIELPGAVGKNVHRITIDGLEREFIVYVPLRAAGTRAPVVFMFHGTSGDGERFFNISGWREKADETGLIAVFPSSLTYCFKEDENGDGDFDDRGELKVTSKWNAGDLGGPRLPLCTAEEIAALPDVQRARADHPLADDLAFVRAMLAVLNNRYSVDASRSYASGFSNGGQLTSRLAQEMSDRFAAIGTAAGPLALTPAPAARPIPVLSSVGQVDDRVTTALGIAALPLDPTLLEQFPGVDQVFVQRMLAVTQIADVHRYGERVWHDPTLGDAKIAGFHYGQSLLGADNAFSFLVIENLGHQYPNGRNHPVVMADILWEFFRNRRL